MASDAVPGRCPDCHCQRLTRRPTFSRPALRAAACSVPASASGSATSAACGQLAVAGAERAFVQRVVVRAASARRRPRPIGPRGPSACQLRPCRGRAARPGRRAACRSPRRRPRSGRTPAAATAAARPGPARHAGSGRARAAARSAPRARAAADRAALAFDEHRPCRVEAAQRLPDQACRSASALGCGWPGTAPSTEPRWQASAFQVEHLRALRGQRLQQPGLAAAGAAAQHAVAKALRQRLQLGTHHARERPCSRLPAARCESRSGRGTRPASPSAGRRASSTPAAAIRAACRPSSGPGGRRCCAPPSPRRRLRACSGETCLYSVPTMRRCSSSSTGQLTAPGRWSSANSAGERTSIDGVEAASAATASAAVMRQGHRLTWPARPPRRAARFRSAAACASAAVPGRRPGRCPRPARPAC